MKTLFALIDGKCSGVQAVLAAEALRKAARTQGRVLEVEVRTSQGSVNPLPDNVQVDGGSLLFIGPDEKPPAGWAGPYLTLATVLADPAGALRALDSGDDASTGQTTTHIVAITSCPTGIAHTFMAAEGLEEGARQLGLPIRVETQGSVGAGNPLTADEIAEAEIVLIAADREVDRSRFAGKRCSSAVRSPPLSAVPG
jgi:PTS system fructose-specific IIC component